MSFHTLIISLVLIIILYRLLKREAIFIPLPQKTIDKMLEISEIKKKDILYDLGSGDGRILITAAKKFGIRTIGIEKNWLLYQISKWNIKRAGVENRVKIINNDFFKQRISDATIITVYLSQRINDKLLPKLKRELKKGTRIVSANHTFKELKEIKRIKTGHFVTYMYKI